LRKRKASEEEQEATWLKKIAKKFFLIKKDTYLCGVKSKHNMVITIKKDTNNQEIDELLLNLKPRKQFSSKQFLGKIKWGEDALEYQKKIRNEWG